MSGHQGQDIFINLRTGKVAVVLGTKAILREKSQSSTGIIEWLVRQFLSYKTIEKIGNSFCKEAIKIKQHAN